LGKKNPHFIPNQYTTTSWFTFKKKQSKSFQSSLENPPKN
jgi:hypothetical protein